MRPVGVAAQQMYRYWGAITVGCLSAARRAAAGDDG
jgi:hypothetical protein